MAELRHYSNAALHALLHQIESGLDDGSLRIADPFAVEEKRIISCRVKYIKPIKYAFIEGRKKVGALFIHLSGEWWAWFVYPSGEQMSIEPFLLRDEGAHWAMNCDAAETTEELAAKFVAALKKEDFLGPMMKILRK